MKSQNGKFKYSERFYSFQGEGKYTGVPTAWIRFYLCNLTCRGFMQENPADPSTYVTPESELIDLKDITSLEELPVFKYGCDSAYSVAKRYAHLMPEATAGELADGIASVITHESNPLGLFLHPLTKQETHMAFTGGEPMLNQDAMYDVMNEFIARNNMPRFVTVETNGTRPLKPALHTFISMFQTPYLQGGHSNTTRGKNEWFWSVSPKLLSTSGEQPKRAIKPEVVAEYAKVSNFGQLKFVVNGSKESWEEVETHVAAFRNAGVDWPVYIMAVGATDEQQREGRIAHIAVEAMKRGYYFSGRLHAYVFGNGMGT